MKSEGSGKVIPSGIPSVHYDNYDKAIGQAYYELFYATQNEDIKRIVCVVMDDMGHNVKEVHWPEVVL